MKRGLGIVASEAGGLTLGLLVIVLAWDASGLDLALARLAGSSQGFPWRDNWLLSTVMHEGARRMAWLLALGLCLAVWSPWACAWPCGGRRGRSSA